MEVSVKPWCAKAFQDTRRGWVPWSDFGCNTSVIFERVPMKACQCKTDFEHLQKLSQSYFPFLSRYPLLHLHKFQQTPVECPEPSVRCRVLNEYIRAPINRIVVDWSPYKPGKHSAQEHRLSVTKRVFCTEALCVFFLRVMKLSFLGAARTWVYLSNWNSRDIWQHNWVPPLLCPEGQNVQKVRRIVNLGCHLLPANCT